MKKVYRYEIDKSTETVEKLHLSEFEVLKETPTGYTINNYGEKKFSRKNTWACETKEIALDNFVLRKRNQIDILNYHKRNCIKAIEIANELLTN
jgi:hypothetical protein